jgi:soluble lytic murein transglycosylase-like protein
MASCTRRPLAVLVATAFVLATLLVTLLPAPADARGRPWPGHPDRRIVTHLVQPGDTATGLAVRYHAWTRELIALNGLGSDATLRVGERVRIPVVVSAAKRDRRTATRPERAATAPQRPSASPKSVRMRSAGWRHWRMSRGEVKAAIAREARRRGVPVRLAQAVAWQESGWHQPVRSSAGAIGVMQVLPATGLWMSLYTGRPLNLRDTHDNIAAGVTLLRVLRDETRNTRRAVAAYYQGLSGVRRDGMYPETRRYVRNVLALRDRL